jgi:hypothetical protein
MERWWAHSAMENQVKTLPEDWQHLHPYFLPKDNDQTLPQVSTRRREQQPPAFVLHEKRDLRMCQRIVCH